MRLVLGLQLQVKYKLTSLFFLDKNGYKTTYPEFLLKGFVWVAKPFFCAIISLVYILKLRIIKE